MIGDDTFVTRRHLLHLQREGKTYFITFVARQRLVLPPEARDLALKTIVYEHERTCYVHSAVIMPDHVHLMVTPFPAWTLPRILRRMKGVSSWRINGLLSRSGPLWQDESFNHILRSDEGVAEKGDYICANPVRAGLVSTESEYPWIWKA